MQPIAEGTGTKTGALGPYTILTPQPSMLDGGYGFALFGPAHLAWLCACSALVALLVRHYRKLPPGTHWGSPRRRMMLAVAALPLLLLVSDDTIMIVGESFPAPWWPLHICNACEYLCLAYTLKPHGAFARFAGEILFCLGITGAFAALLFCNWAYCPPLTWPSICGFLEHTLILAFVLMLLFGGDLTPRVRDLWKAAAFAACYGAVMHPLNAALGTNFGFINQPANGSPLVAIAKTCGNPGYLVPYALLVLAACLAMHAVWAAHPLRHLAQKVNSR